MVRRSVLAASAISALILMVPARDLLAIAQGAPMDSPPGGDFVLYREAAARWLGGRGFYEGWQLTGHYAIWGGVSPVLYPPLALLLLVPFTFLPAALWWAIPAAMIVWSLWHLRPASWSWPFIALWAAWPPTLVMVMHGNPVIWALAAAAVGSVIAGPAVLVLIKPTLAPFALIGANRRRWWFALGGLMAVSLPFGPMWVDWIRAVLNGDGSLAYSIQEIPVLSLPLIALAGRRSGRRRRTMTARRVLRQPGRPGASDADVGDLGDVLPDVRTGWPRHGREDRSREVGSEPAGIDTVGPGACRPGNQRNGDERHIADRIPDDRQGPAAIEKDVEVVNPHRQQGQGQGHQDEGAQEHPPSATAGAEERERPQ